ncbi:MAG: hypothetical protein ND807_07790 [Vicinamibacterales bacterium]|nr:hypothetical protein [Vicinamibacterales bacterium]
MISVGESQTALRILTQDRSAAHPCTIASVVASHRRGRHGGFVMALVHHGYIPMTLGLAQ